MREIELLAPAKDYDAVCAAIDHGADAVYMGGTRFGARAAACNSLEDVARAVEYAHQYGAKLYVTLNTLLYDNELEEAERAARELIEVGIDALIVQDMAYARMGLEVDLHASTQMCNMSVEGVKFLSDVGFRRVVLERNLTLEEISRISRECETELEIFIHGAICVGYSGRCYLSRAITPSRSGNRGECSQSCRLSYDLCSGSGHRIIEAKHLLSVQDLNLTEHIGDLLDCGATSFKVEGRLKDISYTKNIIAHYRGVIDRAMAEREGLVRSSRGSSTLRHTPIPERSFARGKTTYMLSGKRGGVASFDTPKAMGERIGTVVAIRGRDVAVEMCEGITLSSGDGICYMTREGLMGALLNGFRGVDPLWLEFSKTPKVAVGTVLYRNYDREYDRIINDLSTPRLIEVRGAIESGASYVAVEYRDGDGYIGRASIEGEDDFAKANNREKMSETIRTQLAKCGNTIFEAVDIDLTGWCCEFIPMANLNALRREALTQLREARLRGALERCRAEERIFREQRDIAHPTKELGGEWGVTNHLAEEFYRDHGIDHIAPSYEEASDLSGATVLATAYCIRREMGECLREGSRLRDTLYLERGRLRFRLDFDCAKCEMRLIKV